MKSLGRKIAEFARDVMRELARMNSAGLGSDGLRALSFDQRRRAAKSALHDSHSGPNRCC
jgi:hypothetical protein